MQRLQGYLGDTKSAAAGKACLPGHQYMHMYAVNMSRSLQDKGTGKANLDAQQHSVWKA